MAVAFDPATFRATLGTVPTPVVVVTAMVDGEPAGLVLGSFTSVSLDPPLVGVFVDRASTSWPRIAATGRFCVNVLTEEQGEVGRRFAAPGDRFAGQGWRPSPGGSPILDGVGTWIDCTTHSVSDAGDHELVLGRVEAAEVGPGAPRPLVFLGGAFGGFAPVPAP